MSRLVAGLPLDAWLLLAAAVGLGLGIQLIHYGRRIRQLRRDPRDDGRR